MLTPCHSTTQTRLAEYSVLYLDFDGVLHPGGAQRSRSGCIELIGEGSPLMFAAHLEELLVDHPQVKIVLTTSWVRALGLKGAKQKLPPGLRERVVGSVYQHAKRTTYVNQRFGLIIQHVAKHGIKRWVALEDTHFDWPEEFLQNLVALQNSVGLGDPAAVQKLVEWLSAVE
jgi:hypothetical protein